MRRYSLYHAKKRNRLILRVLMLVSLAIAACCLVVALSVTANQLANQTLPVENLPPQSSPGTPTEVSADNSTTANATGDGQAAEEAEPTINFFPPTPYQGKLVNQVKLAEKEKVVSLTFDDGPWPRYTPQILDILQKNHIKATFFWIGRMVKEYPDLAKRVVAEGHVVANHTWSHRYARMNKTTAAKEIDDTAEIIYKTTGVKTTYFRPPGGILTNGVADYAKQKDYAVVKWSNDSIDYRPYSGQRIANNVLRTLKHGDIILMHDGGGNRSGTVKALTQIIASLKQQGYEFVTLPELFEMEIKDKEEAAKAAKEKEEAALAAKEQASSEQKQPDAVKTEENLNGSSSQEEVQSPDSVSPETQQDTLTPLPVD